MANIAKNQENTKATANNSGKEVTLKRKATAPATIKEETPAPAPIKEDAPAPAFEDKTPTMLADPQYCWDLMCKTLGADEATPRGKRDANTIDRQFYGIARATTLALLVGGHDAFVKRVENLDTVVNNKTTPSYVSDLLAKGYPRQAVTCVVELCILAGVKFHSDLFEKFYICTEDVKNRGELLGAKILEKYDTLGVSEEDADAFVRRFSSAKISDKKLLEYIKEHGVDYDTAIKALSTGGQKMRLDFEELKKLHIYEINYTSNSAVKDFVYFVIK